MVEVLRDKPEGLGFDSGRVIWIFHDLFPSGRTMYLRSTQPLTKMSTRDHSQRVKAAGA